MAPGAIASNAADPSGAPRRSGATREAGSSMHEVARMRAGNFHSRRWTGIFLVLAAGGLFTCGRHQESAKEAKKPVVAPTDQVWVRHIFIQYAGAYGAPPEIKRSRSSADSLAHALVTRARAGEDFGVLAKQFSDDESRAEGGEIAPLVPKDPHSPVPP